MPRVRCRVCDGCGVIGQDDRNCPECGGRGYTLKSHWEIDQEKENDQFLLREVKPKEYILLRKLKPKLKYEAPGCGFFVIALMSICALAWIFSIFVSWEREPWLKWVCIVPLIILLLVSLPDIIKKIKKKREHR